MTHDPAIKKAAQAAIDYIQKAQGARGSWGYTARTDNDTSAGVSAGCKVL